MSHDEFKPHMPEQIRPPRRLPPVTAEMEGPSMLSRAMEQVDKPQFDSKNDMTPLLIERSKTHGNWEDQAGTANTLKNVVRLPAWQNLSAMQQEAVDAILIKVSRIVNGDPNHADHWRDIVGYAQLVADRL